MSLEQRRERFDSTTIAVVIASIGFWVLVNWPFHYVATAHQYTIASNASIDFSFQTFLFPRYEFIKGGFPFSYFYQEGDAAPVSPRDWLGKWLLLDFSIALISTVIAGCVAYRLQLLATTIKWKTWFGVHRGPTLARTGIVSALALFAAILVGVVVLNDRSDRQLASQLSTVGAVHRYTLVPKPLIRVLPSPLLARFARIRGVVIWGRSPALLARATRVPTLTSFGAIGKAPTAQELSLLANLDRFNHLNLFNLKIDEPLRQVILNAKNLRRLELIGCEGLKEGGSGLSRLNRLQSLDLTNSDVCLASLPATGWPESLVTMNLSRPFQGSDSLVLRDLPRLKNLRIQRTDLSLNSDLVSIDVANVPSLKYLGIETMQKVSLKIESAPRLEAIGTGDQQVERRAIYGEMIPVAMWVESLDLSNLQSLRDLNCDGTDLKKVSLRGTPNLSRLAIGRFGYFNGITIRASASQFKTRVQSLIDDVALCDGPVSLDLSSLPLEGVDLNPLSRNKKIRTLILVGCGITGSQLPAISRLPRLSKLDLRGCPISDTDTLELLQKGLPLDELLVNSDEFERIEVIDQSKLRGFLATDSPHVKTVRITGSPELEAELVLGNRVGHLDINDGYSLLGLSIDGPIPPNAKLHGLRSLRFFAIGGPRADDDLCRNLWQCKELDHLTIAYGHLSRRSLEKIGLFTKLTVLSVPGSDVDDELVLGHWSNLLHLSDVNFSDTNISSGTLRFLFNSSNLQKLAINHCQVSKRDLADLVKVNQLVELEVAGIGLDSQTLAGCLRRGMLDRLDLSYSMPNNEDVRILASRAANSLRFLGLRDCGLNEAQLRLIIQAHPELSLDIDFNAANADLIAELSPQKRLIDRHDRDAFLRHLAKGQLVRLADIKAEFDPTRGRINHQQFNETKQPKIGL